MGNQASILEELLPQFSEQEQKSSIEQKYLTHKKTGHILIMKQMQLDENNDLQKMTNILTNLQQNKSSFVTQLVHWQYIGNHHCSSGKIVMLFSNIGTPLNQVLETIDEAKWLSQEQITNLLQCILKGAKYFKQVQHQHHDIRLSSIFTNLQKTVLIDPFLVQDLAHSGLPSDFSYKSPEKQLFQHDQIQAYDPTKSILYEIGLMILDIETKFQVRKIYQHFFHEEKKREKQGISFRREDFCSKIRIQIGKLLQKVQNFKLRSKLAILLNPDPEKRLVIFNILLPQKLALSEFNFRKNQITTTGQHRRLLTERTLGSKKKSVRSLSKSPSKQQKSASKILKSPLPVLALPTQIQIHSHTRPPSPENNSLSNYYSYQGTPESRSIEKPSRMNTSSMQQQPSFDTSFTYAQMLRTPTETSNYFSSKNDSPVGGVFRQPTSQWPFKNRGGISQRSRDRYQKERLELQRLNAKMKSKKKQVQTLILPTISSVSNLHEASYSRSTQKIHSPIASVMSPPIKSSQYSLEQHNQNLTSLTGTSTDDYNGSTKKSSGKNILKVLNNKSKVPPLNIGSLNFDSDNSKRFSKTSGQSEIHKYEESLSASGKKDQSKPISGQDSEQKLSPEYQQIINKLQKLFSFQKSGSNSSHKHSPQTPSFSLLKNKLQYSEGKSKIPEQGNQQNEDVSEKKKTFESVEQEMEKNLNEENMQMSYIQIEEPRKSEDKQITRNQLFLNNSATPDHHLQEELQASPRFVEIDDCPQTENQLDPNYLSEEDRKKILEEGLKIIADAQKRKQMKFNKLKNKEKNQSKTSLQPKETESIMFDSGIQGKSNMNESNKDQIKNQTKFGGSGYQKQIFAKKFGGFGGLFPRDVQSIKNCIGQQYPENVRPFPPPPSLQTLQTLRQKQSQGQKKQSSNSLQLRQMASSIPSLNSSILYSHFPVPFAIQSQKSPYPFPQLYQGQTSNNLKNGKGTFYFKNGFIYEGQWKNNKQNGIGKVYKRKNGTHYDWKSLTKEPHAFEFIGNGVWENGKMIKQIHLSTITLENSHTLVSGQKLQPSIANLVPPSSISYSGVGSQTTQLLPQPCQNQGEKSPRVNRYNFHYINATSMRIDNQTIKNPSSRGSTPNVSFNFNTLNSHVHVSQSSLQKNCPQMRGTTHSVSINSKGNARKV